MLAFLSKRLQLWLLLALGVPLIAWLLGFIGDRIEARTGPTTTTRVLRKARGWLNRRSRGPLAHHDETPDNRPT
ncbi:hypothetical protein [Pseudonocardia spinosispora]|uniref:hypothetical protein n=1 Tax=Pseudonocardia spinosispora TaxID=103441 RepID=UPI0004057CC9|nr:hypothetical protein [Pseudonocardia spinosispora]